MTITHWLEKSRKVDFEFMRQQTLKHFCDPHWDLICHNKWHSRISEISPQLEIAVGTHFHAWHGTKTTPVCLPVYLDGEACCLLLPSLVSFLSSNTVRAGNTYSCILKVTGQVWQNKKRISIKTNHSYHQHSSSGVNLNWSTSKIWFTFNQPNREKWGASLVNVIKHLLYKVILLWQHHYHLDPLASITNVFSRNMVF